jgi:short subunit dehydrogenase-like uncharacterized protein
MSTRPFDIIVYGASGYSGTITCEYLANKASANIKWAIAGRDERKLEALRSDLAKINVACAKLTIFKVDANEHAEILGLASKTRVLCSFVGPYRVYGEPIVRACVEAGTDYVDVTGEPPFYSEVIEKHHAAAAAKKLYILPACGVGSLITDFAMETLKEAFGKEATVVSGRSYVKYNGRYAKTFSNGTWNTLVNSMASKPARPAKKEGETASGAEKKKARAPRVGLHLFKPLTNWAYPFVEGADLHTIRRTNELNLKVTGNEAFTYAQFTLLPIIPPLWLLMTLFTMFIILFCSKFSFVRNKLKARSIPNGGPNKEQRSDSSVDVYSVAKDANGNTKSLHLHCPGPYDTTGIACGETALALVTERDSLRPVYGVVTPGSVMVKQLQKNLKERGSTTWEIFDKAL